MRLAAALRPALAARGVPDAIYVDNGSAFVDAALRRAAARLGVKISHSAPGRPQGRGKIERFFGVVRQEFLVEIGDGASVTDLPQLNKLFTAWYETVYHTRPHGETGQPPIERWLASAPFPPPRRPSCGRRSCGPSTGWSARTPRSSCSAAPMRPTRCWPAAASSAFSTVRSGRRRGPVERQALRPCPPAAVRRHSHPKAKPRPPPPRRRRPGSTTWASSPPSMRRPPAGTASATTPWPRAAPPPSQASRTGGGRAVSATRRGPPSSAT